MRLLHIMQCCYKTKNTIQHFTKCLTPRVWKVLLKNVCCLSYPKSIDFSRWGNYHVACWVCTKVMATIRKGNGLLLFCLHSHSRTNCKKVHRILEPSRSFSSYAKDKLHLQQEIIERIWNIVKPTPYIFSFKATDDLHWYAQINWDILHVWCFKSLALSLSLTS